MRVVGYFRESGTRTFIFNERHSNNINLMADNSRTSKATNNTEKHVQTIDLTSTESMSLDSDSIDSRSDGGESEFVESSRRYLRYACHYHELLCEFWKQARGGDVHSSPVDTKGMDEMVEDWIWKLMDHDLRHLEDYMEE